MTTTTTPATLAGTDLDYIVRQIGDGTAALDSWSRQAAGGSMRHDDAREYWLHLPVDPHAGIMRAARVTVYRDAPGRWTIGDVDVFTAAAAGRHVTDDQAAEIVAAVTDDDRTIVRAGAAYVEIF
jgi:hypothetical protein